MDTEGDLEINVLKILSAQKQCELSLLSLMRLLRKMKIKEGEDPIQLRQKLESFARVITVIEGESLSSTTARIKPSMSVCNDHTMKKGTCPKGENCEDLHICKYFLLSDFCTSHQCIYCHSLNSPHNQKVLRLHRLDQLTLEDMRNIFRCPWNRCVVTTPELCHKFKRNTCKDLTKKCFRIHLCPDYISGSCTSGADCDGHDVSEKSVTDILEKYGIDTQRSEGEVLGDLRELDLSPTPLSRSRFEPVLDQPDGPSGRGIPRRRGLGRGLGDQKSGTWRGRGARGGHGSRGARGGFGGVRGRGENRNREEQPQIHNRPHPLLETYCPPPSQHPHTHHDMLEDLNRISVLLTNLLGWVLWCFFWLRTNFDPRRKKQICPREWSIGQTNEEQLLKHYTKVKVSETTDEFQKIANLFHETLPPNRTIVSLERIENGELWIDFDGQRGKMERRAKKPVAERQLFHGTTEEKIEAISREGFDFRFSGSRVGAIHGAGSYFAREAKYSDGYAKEAGSVKRMFVALVLVGEYTQGHKDHRRPPAKSADNPHELFDSCVDDVNDPKIFVLFKLDQVYPQYIITYI